MKKRFAPLLCVGLALSSFAAPPANAPAVDVDYQKNLHLWRAQKSILTAFENIQAAPQKSAHGFGNHAHQAEELLIEAAKELKAASIAAADH